MSAITPVTSALTSAFARFDRASSDVLRAANGGESLPTAIADQIHAKEAVGAGLAVLQTQAKFTKALLDIKV
ncbi:MAG TPA: hypothetical protein VG939_20705 [Caulobacteraceae bacterium]|nr:hypothetical protein [Caulobacteraceae bacterium]